MRQAEPPPDDVAAAMAEDPLYLLGGGIGGDVVVLRGGADEQVADRAADDVRLEAGAGKLADNAAWRRIQLFAQGIQVN